MQMFKYLSWITTGKVNQLHCLLELSTAHRKGVKYFPKGTPTSRKLVYLMHGLGYARNKKTKLELNRIRT